MALCASFIFKSLSSNHLLAQSLPPVAYVPQYFVGIGAQPTHLIAGSMPTGERADVGSRSSAYCSAATALSISQGLESENAKLSAPQTRLQKVKAGCQNQGSQNIGRKRHTPTRIKLSSLNMTASKRSCHCSLSSDPGKATFRTR